MLRTLLAAAIDDGANHQRHAATASYAPPNKYDQLAA